MNQHQHANPSCAIFTCYASSPIFGSHSVRAIKLFRTRAVPTPGTSQLAHHTIDPINECPVVITVSTPQSTPMPHHSNYLRTFCTAEPTNANIQTRRAQYSQVMRLRPYSVRTLYARLNALGPVECEHRARHNSHITPLLLCTNIRS